jgi:hypothetical protein
MNVMIGKIRLMIERIVNRISSQAPLGQVNYMKIAILIFVKERVVAVKIYDISTLALIHCVVVGLVQDIR